MSLSLFLFAVPGLAWLHFAFVAERLNPFTGPSAPLRRRRWRFARRLTGGGLIAVAASAAWLGAGDAAPGGPRAALAIGVLVYLGVGIASWTAYRRRKSLWGPMDHAAPTASPSVAVEDHAAEATQLRLSGSRDAEVAAVARARRPRAAAPKPEAGTLAKRLRSRPVDIVI